jgi:23S rRNA (cytidine1920-2'-O)/16S rRNA (cytidine1409-2'-O)-methyltransferase
VARVRLDTLLAERGLFESRARAAASVMAGEVRVGGDGRRAQKPGQLVDPDVPVAVDERPRFASRGGVKLANALAAFGLDVAGRHALDVGASTGGFTDCLLQAGAAHVVALDVGASTGGFTDCLLQAGAAHVVALDVAYGELDWRLRNDERVTVLERSNARALVPGDLPYAPDLVVVDVSFISLTKVLPAVLACVAPRHDVLAMVKPQFEVGRGRVGKGGVVRDAALRRSALVDVASAARGLGASVLGFASSELPGPKGNRESFVWLAEGRRDGDVADLDAAARLVEP